MTHGYLTTYIPNEAKRLVIKEKLEASPKVDKVHFSNDPRHVGVAMKSFATIKELNNLTLDIPEFEFIKTIDVHPNFKEEIDTTGFISTKLGAILIAVFILVFGYEVFFKNTIDFITILRVFFGVLLTVFGLLKFKNYLDFTEAHQRYDLISKHFCFYAYVYPAIEIVLGFLLILNIEPVITYITLSFILTMRAIGVLYAIAFGPGVEYAYLEGALKLRVSSATLFIDFILIAFSFYQLSILLIDFI